MKAATKPRSGLGRIAAKRVYEPAAKDDGTRILVDRLWPRGIKKEAAKLDLWLQEIAPSDALRRWFGHDPARWDEFKKRYRAELKAEASAVRLIRDALKKGNVTLLFAAKDEAHNNAVALQHIIEQRERMAARRKARAAG